MRLGTLAALLGALGVVAGAFGAHALRGHFDPAALAVFETAARYHLLHALAAVFAADRGERGAPSARLAAALLLVGVALFSGSLYALALTGVRAWGAVTPLGGVALIGGWLALAISFRASRTRGAGPQAGTDR